MSPKNPVGKLAETALSTLKDPKAAAGKVVDQAKGTVALGRIVADTAGAAVGRAAGRAAGRATGMLGGRPPAKEAPRVPRQAPAPKEAAGLRAVPDVNEPASPGAEDSPKKHGDVLTPPKTPVTKAPAEKTAETGAPAARQAPARQAPAKQAPAKKAPPKKATAKEAPAARKSVAKKAPAKKVTASPADVADVVEAAVAENPAKTAAKKAAKKTPAKKTPAKKAPAAKKTPADKPSPGGKLPAKKSRPKSAAELAANEGDDVRTQAGTAAASEGMNPSTGDTSLTQPGTPPVADSSTAKQVASEAEQLRKASEQTPE